MLEITERSTERVIQTKRWKIRYYEAGEGFPVIMLHGTGPGATGWSNFSPNIQALAPKYRVISMDLPGWGGSDPLDPSEEARTVAQAESVKLLMDELGIEKAALVGNSMGGAIALHFAAMYPERLSHMITMGCLIMGSPAMFSPAGFSEGVRIIRETYADPSPANFRRLVSIMVYDSSFVTDELCEMRSKASLANQTHLTNWLKPPKAGMPVGELLEKVAAYKGPSLFIHGRDDRVIPLENTLRLVSLVQDSQAHIFNRCGHWVQIEHAKEFNALIDGFLQTHGVTPSSGAGSATAAPVTAPKEKAWGG